jgi:hypothetical protein
MFSCHDRTSDGKLHNHHNNQAQLSGRPSGTDSWNIIFVLQYMQAQQGPPQVASCQDPSHPYAINAYVALSNARSRPYAAWQLGSRHRHTNITHTHTLRTWAPEFILLGGYDQEPGIMPSSQQDVDLRGRCIKAWKQHLKVLGLTIPAERGLATNESSSQLAMLFLTHGPFKLTLAITRTKHKHRS